MQRILTIFKVIFKHLLNHIKFGTIDSDELKKMLVDFPNRFNENFVVNNKYFDKYFETISNIILQWSKL